MKAFSVLRQHPLLIIGLILMAALILFGPIASLLVDPDGAKVGSAMPEQPPSAEFPLGTDAVGRQLLPVIVVGTPLTLRIGLIAGAIGLGLGVIFGFLAGYFGGLIDTLIMRTVDTFTAFPFLIMVIGIIAILGPGLTSMYIALTLAGWSAYARIIRGEILVIKKSEYVLAARSLGYHNARIIFRHVLPNVITPAIIFAMTDIVLVILSTTSLSFLGLGVQPPTPEWGSMIAEGRSYIMLAWWMVTLPGLAIVLVGFALSLFGDGVADLLRNED